MASLKFLSPLAILLFVGACAAPPDPCAKHAQSKQSCLSPRTGANCSWCTCVDLPPSCLPFAEAAKLPPSSDEVCTNRTHVAESTVPATMRAYQLPHLVKSFDELVLAQIPTPKPAAGEVLIKVSASSVP